MFVFGFIINELFINTLEHAFQKDQKGKINISVKKTDNGFIEINFSDNEKGIPNDLKLKTANTIGLQTVYMIVEHQLQDTVSYDSINGVAFNIRFNGNLYKERI